MEAQLRQVQSDLDYAIQEINTLKAMLSKKTYEYKEVWATGLASDIIQEQATQRWEVAGVTRCGRKTVVYFKREVVSVEDTSKGDKGKQA